MLPPKFWCWLGKEEVRVLTLWVESAGIADNLSVEAMKVLPVQGMQKPPLMVVEIVPRLSLGST